MQDLSGSAQFWRGLVLFTRRDSPGAAAALRAALVVFHDFGNRRGMTNVLSGVVGLVLRTGRAEPAAALLGGLRAARDEFALRGSANERHAEQRIEQLLRNSRAAAGALDGRPLDLEATIDLALVALDEIAADGQRA